MEPPRLRRLHAIALSVGMGLCAHAALAEGLLGLREARAAVASGHPETVYLAWSSLRPRVHPAGDRAVTEVLLLAGRKALEANESALAMGLMEIARRLQPGSIDACLLLAEAARRLHLPGAAAEALDQGIERHPRNGSLLLSRARLAEAEGEGALATRLLQRIPKRSPEATEARLMLARLQVSSRHPRPPAEDDASDDDGAEVKMRSAEAGVAGMVARASEHFRLIFSEAARAAIDPERFSIKVLTLLEDAWRRIARRLDYEPKRIFDVVLYTRAEYALHFNGSIGGLALGFYGGKIQMIASDTFTGNDVSVAIHELTHAFLHARCERQIDQVPAWFDEGLAEWIRRELTGDGARGVRRDRHLRETKEMARRLRLSALRVEPLTRLGPSMDAAYLKSWAAVAALIGTGQGVRRVGELCDRLRTSASFETALREVYGTSAVAGLEDDANRLLAP